MPGKENQEEKNPFITEEICENKEFVYMVRVLFVCLGNICRSPMAEFLFRDMVQKQGLSDCFEIASAATSNEEIGNPPHYGTRQKLASLGISCQGKRARRMTSRDFDEYDYLLGMETWNVRNMKRFARNTEDEEKIFRLLDFSDHPRDIADPWYTGDFETTYNDIMEGLHAFLEFLKEKEKL